METVNISVQAAAQMAESVAGNAAGLAPGRAGARPGGGDAFARLFWQLMESAQEGQGADTDAGRLWTALQAGQDGDRKGKQLEMLAALLDMRAEQWDFRQLDLTGAGDLPAELEGVSALTGPGGIAPARAEAWLALLAAGSGEEAPGGAANGFAAEAGIGIGGLAGTGAREALFTAGESRETPEGPEGPESLESPGSLTQGPGGPGGLSGRSEARGMNSEAAAALRAAIGAARTEQTAIAARTAQETQTRRAFSAETERARPEASGQGAAAGAEISTEDMPEDAIPGMPAGIGREAGGKADTAPYPADEGRGAALIRGAAFREGAGAEASGSRTGGDMLSGQEQFAQAVREAKGRLSSGKNGDAKVSGGEDEALTMLLRAAASRPAQAAVQTAALPAADSAELPDQLIGGLSRNLNLGKGEFVLKLEPEGLGEVTVKLLETEGRTTLRIVTASAETARLINDELHILQEALRPVRVEVREAVPETSSGKESDAYDPAFDQFGQSGQFQQFQQFDRSYYAGGEGQRFLSGGEGYYGGGYPEDAQIQAPGGVLPERELDMYV